MTKEEYECEFQALICEREGMIAFNRERELDGWAPGYSYGDFMEIADAFRELAKNIFPKRRSSHGTIYRRRTSGN